VALGFEQPLSHAQFEQWNAFLHGAPRDAEEVLPVGLGKPAVPLGNIGGDGQSGTVELVGQKKVTAREAFGQGAYGIGKGDRFLIDKKFEAGA